MSEALFSTVTTEPLKPLWIAEFPGDWPRERVDRLTDDLSRQLQSGSSVLMLPEGVHLRSTAPVPYIAPDLGPQEVLGGWTVFPWAGALSVVALLLAVAAIVLALAP